MLNQYRSLSRTVHILCVGALVNRAGAFMVPFLTLYLGEALGLGVGFATSAMGVYGVGALAVCRAFLARFFRRFMVSSGHGYQIRERRSEHAHAAATGPT